MLLRDPLGHRLREQIVLVVEVVIDGRLRDAGVDRDVLETNASVAVAGEELQRGVAEGPRRSSGRRRHRDTERVVDARAIHVLSSAIDRESNTGGDNRGRDHKENINASAVR
jgi:hypothetical protein